MFETTNQVIFVTYIVVRVYTKIYGIVFWIIWEGGTVFLSSRNASYNSVTANDWLLGMI